MSRLFTAIGRNRETGAAGLGRRGERLAAAWLAGLGYRVVAVNVRIPVGRLEDGRTRIGELDVVAFDGETLVFVEVKTRRTESRLPIESAVDLTKRRRLIAAARRYRALFGLRSVPCRFDVLVVLWPRGKPPLLRHRKGWFADHVRTDPDG